MTNIGELERLTDEEAADLADRLERFRAAWQTDGSTGLEPFLPPPGARHRIAVLVQLSLIDMQRRAEARLPFRAESYLESFPDDLASASALAPLLAGEHRLRHRLGDNPGLEEYQRRFPAAFDEFARKLTQPSPQPTAGPGEHTPVGVIPPQGRHLQETASDGRRRVPPSNGRIGELVVTDSVNFGSTRANRDDSTMLPTDAPYQLVRKIGSGAFGEVFEALAPGGIRVAVKRIMRSVDHPASKSEREALDSIKGLSHPFLLKTNAYWVFDDRLVIVMELADGSLSDRLEHHQHLGRPGVPPEELVPIFEQAGEALDYLHSQNVSHRDVKPENILLLQGYAKVCDFGLAHLHQHTMTEVQSTVGTPAYMAPEMWKQKVSLHSDQYALAATYVRARLGRPLFSTPVLIDLAQAHVSETPNLDPLPAAEQKVLLKALAKNPDERFASCQEFARALRAAVFPPPEPPKPPPVPTPRQGRGALWAALGVALACALAVALVNYFTQNRDDAKQQTLDNQNGKEKDKDKPPVVLPPEKQYVNYPAGWQPSPAEGAHRLGERHYHAKLTRKVGDIELVAHLLFPTNPTDPTPFYILEHKLMNKVFKALWDEAAGQEKVKQLLETKQHLLPGRWRNAEGGRELDLDGEDADLPVLGVTLPEAMIVAEWLGGRLPTHRQWLKAAGLLEGNQKDGPAGSPLQPPKLPREELLAWKREQFQKRKLALGLEAPLAIYDPRAAGDVSRWKIRQLVTNGAEWLGQSDARPESRLQLFPAPAGQQFALVVGHSASEDEIDAAGFLRNESPAAYEWDRVDGLFASFRVVLEPR